MPPLETGSGIATTSKEKAEALADSLEAQFLPHQSRLPVFSNNVEEEVDKFLAIFPSCEPELTTQDELQDEINALKKGKAPGSDQISNKVLSYLPPRLLVHLLWIMNACLSSAHFPSAWKHAIVVSFPKNGKNHRLPSSYRPISLLCTMGKLFEKIFLKRLTAHIERFNILPNEQFRFRPGHDTSMQVMRLVEKTAEGLAEKRDTATILLDVAKAFDSVWHKGVIFKLTQIRLPDIYVHLVWSFLKGRSFACRVNEEISTSRPCRAGVPQGAITSSTLYTQFTRTTSQPSRKASHVPMQTTTQWR